MVEHQQFHIVQSNIKHCPKATLNLAETQGAHISKESNFWCQGSYLCNLLYTLSTTELPIARFLMLQQEGKKNCQKYCLVFATSSASSLLFAYFEVCYRRQGKKNHIVGRMGKQKRLRFKRVGRNKTQDSTCQLLLPKIQPQCAGTLPEKIQRGSPRISAGGKDKGSLSKGS